LPAKTDLEQQVVMRKSSTAHKRGSIAMSVLHRTGLLGMAVCIAAVGVVLSNAADAELQHGKTAVTCTNPYSGVSWQIKIDYDQRTVNADPAQIGDATISWRDSANGWYYVLDRKSGKLTVTLASATGGSFLHDTCKLEN
jgi:hypothetical protein